MIGRVAEVAVVGAAHATATVLAMAEVLGRRLFAAGYLGTTGDLAGIMAAACRGARSSSGSNEGDSIGVPPRLVAEDADDWVDLVIVRDMNHPPNVFAVAFADFVVAAGGRPTRDRRRRSPSSIRTASSRSASGTIRARGSCEGTPMNVATISSTLLIRRSKRSRWWQH